MSSFKHGNGPMRLMSLGPPGSGCENESNRTKRRRLERKRAEKLQPWRVGKGNRRIHDR
jgi:hypothetical protein